VGYDALILANLIEIIPMHRNRNFILKYMVPLAVPCSLLELLFLFFPSFVKKLCGGLKIDAKRNVSLHELVYKLV
jgi:hypothetical protein